ncbi:MAG: hypothetical protein EOO13_14910 [Chitinophagaceae bacterium]|nr:MAG: hypothetical protein EOO13_14910 [Chitinophagaceae bacterium]
MTDQRIDEYIERSADFAKPILKHIRELVHNSCPDVQENIKWGMPFFEYKNDILCHMASFKQHCAMGFWKASLFTDTHKIIFSGTEGMGQLGKIHSLGDLPSGKILSSLLKQGMRLNEEGIKVKKNIDKAPLAIPAYFETALKKNKVAANIFEKFAPSHKKEYIKWLEEAKTPVTRQRRLDKALERIADGRTKD